MDAAHRPPHPPDPAPDAPASEDAHNHAKSNATSTSSDVAHAHVHAHHKEDHDDDEEEEGDEEEDEEEEEEEEEEAPRDPSDAQSVSAVAVIDLSDHPGASDPHGLLTSSVVVIGGDDAAQYDAHHHHRHEAHSHGHSHSHGTGGHGDGDGEGDGDGDGASTTGDDDECGCGSDHHLHHSLAHGHAQLQLQLQPQVPMSIPMQMPMHMHMHMPPPAMTSPLLMNGEARPAAGGHGGRGGGGGAAASGGLSSPSPSTVSTTGSTNLSLSGKRKRVVLSIHDKQQVLQRLELGEAPVALARDFGISRQQVSDIKKNRDRILAFCLDAKHLSTLRRKTLRATTAFHPGVEQELYRWLIRQRRLGRAVHAEAVTSKATDLFLQYMAEDAAPGSGSGSGSGTTTTTTTTNVSARTVSVWLRQFKRAHGIKLLNEYELAKLPAKFVPAMDMAQDGSTPPPQPMDTSTAMNMNMNMNGSMTIESGNGQTDAGAEYLSSLQQQQQHLQHMAQDINTGGSHNKDAPAATSFQMLMLSAATTSTSTSTSTPTVMTMPVVVTSSADGGGDATTSVARQAPSLLASIDILLAMTAQLTAFEREIVAKLDEMDARVAKIRAVLPLVVVGSSHARVQTSVL